MKCPTCKAGKHKDCNCTGLRRVSVPESRTSRIYWLEVTCCCKILIDEIGHKKIETKGSER